MGKLNAPYMVGGLLYYVDMLVEGGVKFYPKILEAHFGDYTPYFGILPLYKGGYPGWGGGIGL